jgi:hypothetical protein
MPIWPDIRLYWIPGEGICRLKLKCLLNNKKTDFRKVSLFETFAKAFCCLQSLTFLKILCEIFIIKSSS